MDWLSYSRKQGLDETRPATKGHSTMKPSRTVVLLAGAILATLVVCWSRAQAPSQLLKVVVDGKEIHTLMVDQHNALVGYLEAKGQTNVLELLRQYRCSYSADLSSSELNDTVDVLQLVREGKTEQAIQRLEQRLGRYSNLMCNSYFCLNATNRERVKLEPIEKTLDYFAKFPPREERSEIDAMKLILKSRSENGRQAP